MTKKPGVVILCDWFDPAFRAGGPVRSLVNLIDLLHHITIFALFAATAIMV
jgi:hypothetical protein